MLSGRLSAWLGRRRAVVTGVLVFALGSVATAAAASIPTLTALRLFTDIGLGAVLPAAVSLSVAQFDPRRREVVAVAVIAGLSLGAVIGGLSGGWLIGHFGWASVFVLGGILPLLLAPALWFGLPTDRAAVTAGSSFAEGRVQELWASGLGLQTGLIWGFAFLIFVSTYALQLWIPTLLLSYGFSPQQAPQGLAAFGVGGLFGAILLTVFSAVAGVFRVLPLLVSADAKLTHCAEVKRTHLGEDGGLLAADVDPGAGSGDQGTGPTRGEHSRDRSADGLFTQHGAAVSA